MFDIGFPEFFIAALVALVVLGPQRLPAALRTLGLWVGRLRRSYYNVKTEVEREIGMDEVRRQLHNEQIMADVKRVEREVRAMGREVAGDAEAAGPALDVPPDAEAALDVAGALPAENTAAAHDAAAQSAAAANGDTAEGDTAEGAAPRA